jgi:hypothetical protein
MRRRFIGGVSVVEDDNVSSNFVTETEAYMYNTLTGTRLIKIYGYEFNITQASGELIPRVTIKLKGLGSRVLIDMEGETNLVERYSGGIYNYVVPNYYNSFEFIATEDEAEIAVWATSGLSESGIIKVTKLEPPSGRIICDNKTIAGQYTETITGKLNSKTIKPVAVGTSFLIERLTEIDYESVTWDVTSYINGVRTSYDKAENPVITFATSDDYVTITKNGKTDVDLRITILN